MCLTYRYTHTQSSAAGAGERWADGAGGPFTGGVGAGRWASPWAISGASGRQRSGQRRRRRQVQSIPVAPRASAREDGATRLVDGQTEEWCCHRRRRPPAPQGRDGEPDDVWVRWSCAAAVGVAGRCPLGAEVPGSGRGDRGSAAGCGRAGDRSEFGFGSVSAVIRSRITNKVRLASESRLAVSGR